VINFCGTDTPFAAYSVNVKASMGEMKVVKLLFLPFCVDLNILSLFVLTAILQVNLG